MKNLLLLFHRQKVSPAAAKSQDRLAKRLQSLGLFWHQFGQCRPVQNTGNHIRFIIASCSIEILRFYNNKKAFKKKDYFKNQKYISGGGKNTLIFYLKAVDMKNEPNALMMNFFKYEIWMVPFENISLFARYTLVLDCIKRNTKRLPA